MKIAITGSNGFIGKNLVAHFLQKNAEIFYLQRKNNTSPLQNYFHFNLAENVNFEKLPFCDVLIHTAFDPYSRKNKNANKNNLRSTLVLEKFCKENNIHFIFLSSYSAHPLALSNYGKSKLEIENSLDKNFSTILKLGLVLGNNGGLYKTIYDSIQKSPNIPLVGGGIQPIQTISIKELTEAIDKVIEKKLKGLFYLAEEKEISMKEFYSTIAKSQNKPIKFLYVPIDLLLLGVKILEFFSFPFPIKSESILGLKRMKAFRSLESQEKIGIKIRSFREKVGGI